MWINIRKQINLHRPFILVMLILTSPVVAQEKQSEEQLKKDALEINPSKELEISDWEARLELARVLSYMQRYNESIKEYEKLLANNPTSAIARREKAAVLFYSGETDEAMREFSQVLDEDRDDKTWLVIADIFVKQMNYNGAEAIYSHYLKKDPKNDKIRLKLASLLSWQKRYDESLRQYEILLNHRPEDIQVRRRYAQVLTWIGHDEAAIEEWKKTLP